MPARIGRIPYLNTEPFFGDDQVRANSVVAPPRQMAALAARGEVDIAPLPLVAHFERPGFFRPLGDFCIACDGPVGSVILKTARPPQDLAGARIGVIDETATSVRLLKVLLAYKHRLAVSPRYEPLTAGHDAVLLIGDRALRDASSSLEHPLVVDLAQEWKGWTGLPFVFALWLVRSDVDQADAGRAISYFSESLERNLAQPEILWRRRSDLGLTPWQVESYVKNFEYRLTDAAARGMARFRELDAELQQKEHAA